MGFGIALLVLFLLSNYARTRLAWKPQMPVAALHPSVYRNDFAARVEALMEENRSLRENGDFLERSLRERREDVWHNRLMICLFGALIFFFMELVCVIYGQYEETSEPLPLPSCEIMDEPLVLYRPASMEPLAPRDDLLRLTKRTRWPFSERHQLVSGHVRLQW